MQYLKNLSRALFAALLLALLSACSRVNLSEMEHMPYTPLQREADVDNGRALFRNRTLGGSINTRSCRSCHKYESELAGVANKSYNSLFGIITRDLEDVINLCIVLPLKGKPYFNDSQEMADLIAYLRSID